MKKNVQSTENSKKKIDEIFFLIFQTILFLPNSIVTRRKGAKKTERFLVEGVFEMKNVS